VSSIASPAVVGSEVHRPRQLVLDRAIAGCLGLAVLLHVGPGTRGLLAAVLVALLVELAAIDLERRILPNRIVLPTLAGVLGAQLALQPSAAAASVAWAFGAGLFLLLPSLVRRGAVGMGDVKLAALLGAALGHLVTAALAIGLSAAGGVALLLLVTRGRGALQTELPLGPFLASGAILAILLAAPPAL
jgi:leader peptidase (prepilin peptidase) / N-methyltransferase